MTENKMFCFQCQETAKGTGCTIKGVCGKEATTSKWQDLLLSVVRGIGTIQHSIGEEPTPEVTRFLTDALFTTITNANFNDQDILQKVDKGIVLKKLLLEAYPGGCRRPQGLLRGDCACQDLPAT
jgi:hydroxylamine reductase